MIVDAHSHVWDYNKHLNKEFIDDYFNNSNGSISLTAYPEEHWEAIGKNVDKAIVFGLKGKISGIYVDDEYVAEYVSKHPDKLIGFMSIDPTCEGIEHIKRCCTELKLKGIKTSPVYTNCSLLDSRFLEVFKAASEFNLPVILHMGPTFPHKTITKYGDPYELEEIAIRFPNVVIVVAHMGRAREKEFMHVIKKHPNLYADISDTAQQPWQCYNALMMYYEQRIMHKLILGSDFPWHSIQETIEGILKINNMCKGTMLPIIHETELLSLIERDTLKLLRIN